MNKKMLILIGLTAIITLLSTLLLIIPLQNSDLQNFTLNNKSYTLKKSDELSVNCWDETEVLYNYKDYSGIPIIYKGITVGTDYKEVLKKFNIKNGYAIVDMEIPNELEDGTTDIVIEPYKNNDIFNREYLDLSISFAYVKDGNEWVMVKYKDLEKYRNQELLTYYIDFNGMTDQAVAIGEVIAFTIRYQ